MKALKRMLLIACGVVIVPIAIFAQTTQTTGEPEPLRGTITGGEVRCYLGVTQPTDPQALKEGEVCQKTSVQCEGVEINKPKPDDLISFANRMVAAVISALAITQGEVGYVTSVCQSGKCVAKFACDGKEFPGLPGVPPTTGGATPVTDPSPEIPSVPSSPSIPSVPATENPQVPSVPPSTTPSPTPSIPDARPVPPTTLPSTNPTVPSSGSTFNPPSASPFQLGARGSGGLQYGNGQYPDGVFSGGNPFYTGSTFGGAANWGSGSSFSSNGVVTNLFSNFVSNVIGNLFSGFGGNFNGGVVTTRPPTSTPAPTPTPTPAPRPSVVVAPPQSPPRQMADIGSMPEDVERELQNYFRLPQPVMVDRIGSNLIDGLSTPREPITGPRVPPTNTPSNINPSPLPDESEGIVVPQPNPIAPPSVVPEPRPLTREVAQATFNQAQADFVENRSRYDKFLDWLGVGSPKGNAYQSAVRDLAAVTKIEGLRILAVQQTQAMPEGVQVAEGGPVMTDGTSIAIEALRNPESILTPAQREQFEAEYQKFIQELDAATPERQQQMLNEVRGEYQNTYDARVQGLRETIQELEKAGGFAPIVLPPEPQLAERPATMLEGLSKIGERVRDAAEEAARAVHRAFNQVSENPPQVAPPSTTVIPPASSATVPDTVTSAPLPPTPAPAPTPAPSAPTPSNQPTQRSNGFVQGSISLLSALVQGVVGFFSNDDSAETPRPTPSAPTSTTISASITANPPMIDDGDTTELAWSSVGAQSCVLVDSLLNEIRRGTNGTTTSPALNESTRFGVICDIADGTDKFVNEVLVRVNGDENEPTRLFSHSGRVSQSLRTSGATADGSLDADGEAGAPAPIDVRTCEPDQSIDIFIKCLCEAEPNPNGCSLVPRN